ncbi:hypothetical protein BaRGS_00001215 [Batillaria attramentaria]|uniref:G-protein coupled receptors family 1 profile domain-containing protein n=1 Tax=Batillaria attramentaria TaxID=370345 RepID=A0ABD0M6E2_9CAEN
MTTVESNDSTVGFFFSSFVTSARTLPVSMAARSLTRDALWEVDDVEWVLAPLTVVLTAVSNITLLAHEGRVVWLTRRLIPPKLLVLSLCSADLLATVTGFLPLWLFFVLPHSASPALLVTSPPEPAWSSSENSSGVSPSVSPSSSVSTDSTSSSDHSVGVAGVNPVVLTAGYSVSVFLLAMFWTLAQCIVVVMGIERFLALRAPFFYTARCSSQAFLAVIGLLALASGGVGAFHMLVHRHDVRTDPVVYAGFVDSGSLAYNAFTLTQGLVWTVVLLLCNWAVTHELRRMEQRVTVMRMKDQSEYLKQLSLVHGAGREFARFMMAVNVVFLLSSLPNLVSNTNSQFRLSSLPNPVGNSVSFRFPRKHGL